MRDILAELDEWKQAASCEAGLRREFAELAHRYRAALLKIVGPDPETTLDEPDMDWEVVEKLRAIASAALSNGSTDED